MRTIQSIHTYASSAGRVLVDPLALALLAALVRAMGLPGWLWGPLTIAAPVLRIAGWGRSGGLAVDATAGMIFGLLVGSFMLHVHPIMPLLPALVFAVTWAFEGFLYRRLSRFVPPLLAAGVALSVPDYLRGTLPFGGLPWSTWAVGFADTALLEIGPVLGEHGASLVVAFAGSCAYEVYRRRRYHWSYLPLPALLAVAWVLREAPVETDRSLRALVTQPSIPLRELQQFPPDALLGIQKRLVHDSWNQAGPVDVVLWNESAWPWPIVEDTTGSVRQRARDGSTSELDIGRAHSAQRSAAVDLFAGLDPAPWLLAGGTFFAPAEGDAISRQSTDLALFDSTGRLADHATKAHPVPIFEQLPFGGRFPGASWLRATLGRSLGLSPDYELGARTGPVSIGADSLGVAICWDTPFEEVFRRQAAMGADAFVIASNEVWFGDSSELQQMLAYTRWRAVETGRAMVRATNNGLTALVLPNGEVAQALTPNLRTTMTVDIPLVSSKRATPYSRWGWLLLPLVTLAGLAIAILPTRSPA